MAKGPSHFNTEEVLSMLEEEEVDEEPMCDGSDDDLGMEMDSDAAERYANSNHDKSSELCRYDSIQ